jgi:hypothetical protein
MGLIGEEVTSGLKAARSSVTGVKSRLAEVTAKIMNPKVTTIMGMMVVHSQAFLSRWKLSARFLKRAFKCRKNKASFSRSIRERALFESSPTVAPPSMPLSILDEASLDLLSGVESPRATSKKTSSSDINKG